VVARTLARCGADVAVHFFKNAAGAAKLCGEISSMNVRACAVQADITSREAIARMRDIVRDRLGAPDIIVNNVVIQYSWRSVLEQAPEDYESQFRSCVLHNVLMAQAFVPAMIEKRFGRVIAINTECAMQNGPTQSAYVSGKRGMDGVLRVLAKEIGGHQITVNQVAPGWMISDKYRGAPAERQEDYSRNVPLRRRFLGTVPTLGLEVGRRLAVDLHHRLCAADVFLALDLADSLIGMHCNVDR
jgi:3-oxoacyl-[acyl-carrier protein] reductase